MARPIVLYENLRTMVYVPFYLAIARGDWAAEGIEVRCQTSPATAETAQGLIDGRVDVSWGGPMRVMLHHDADPDCALVCFAQVVARDPFILVGRERKRRFRFSDLTGRRVAVATEVPTPWMTFQDDLARAGIDPAALDRAADRPMAENLAALEAGEVDVIQVFEPYADRAVRSGVGHLWHRFATRGDIAYTSFYTTRRFAEEERAVCRALVRGIARAQQALRSETPMAIARTIAGFFPETPAAELARVITGYRASGLWAETPALPATAFGRLKAALLSGGLIERDIPYQRVVDAELSSAFDTIE
ncbi:MAG: ABC transporter substrate-binding protein [Alphaproteobacteria bacterium]|nr:ABC transporter substrate-binding protein [Alphaproteobacteria bacterium]